MEQRKTLPLITSAFLILTQRCNLKCKYCFMDKYPQEMNYKVAKDATDFLIKNAEESNQVPQINFFGGEPMLKWDDIIVPLVTYIRKEYGKPFSLSMTTNGTLLSKERIQFIKENDIGILMSIDGNKCTSDINRPFPDGRSSFDVMSKFIPDILSINKNATFRMTLDHDNSNELVDNCKFAYESGYNNVFFIPNVGTKWTSTEIEDMKSAIHNLADWYMDEIIENEKYFSINQFGDAFRKIERINTMYNNRGYRNITNAIAYGRCGLGANRFASVGTDGKLYSCQEMSGNRESGDLFCIGDIYNGTDNDKRWDIIDRFQVKQVRCENEDRCKGCRMYNICDGHCTINNYFSTGDLNVVPEILCIFYQVCLEECIRIMNVMSEKENTFFRDNIFKNRR